MPGRRICIRDGEAIHELVVPADARLADALRFAGVGLTPTTRVLKEREGSVVDLDQRADTIADGDVFAIIDTAARVDWRIRRKRPTSAPGWSLAAAWWLLGAIGAVTAAVAFLSPSVFDAAWRLPVILALAVGALVAGVVDATRSATATGSEGGASLGLSMLVIAAAVVATPPSVFSPTVTLMTATASAAVFAGVLALLSARVASRAELSTLAVIWGALATLFAVAILVSLPATAIAPIVLAAVPAALRALPAGVIDVPPGMFLDYERYQQTRWAVREKLPPVIETIDFDRASVLVARSTARMRTATITLSVIAAVAAPFALGTFRTDDVLVFIGQTALAVTVILALALGARRFSARLLRWTVRAAAAVVLLVVVIAVAGIIGELGIVVGAAGMLLIGLGSVGFLVPVARGTRSLWWSRFADFFETLGVVLAPPAGMIAAGIVEFVRGLMGG